MKYWYGFLVLMVLAGAVPALASGTVVQDSVFSTSLGQYKQLSIYLPEGYPVGGPYPVVYFLHGIGDGVYHPPVPDNYVSTEQDVDAMITGGEIRPIILVRPDGMVGPYGGSMWTNSELYGLYEDLVAHEVIPFVDAHYATAAVRGSRMIIGHSMGGFGALIVALKHPYLFSAVYSLSGLVDWEPISLTGLQQMLCMENGGVPPYNWNPAAGFVSGAVFTAAGAFSPDFFNPPYMVDLPVDAFANWVMPVLDHWNTHMPPAALRDNLGALNGLNIFLDVGTQDELGFYYQNLAFGDSLTALGVPFSLTTFLGGHSDQFDQRFEMALRQLDNILPVELTAFDAIPVSGAIRLSWTTATETNNARFEITRDNHVITSIPGAGTSPSEHHYVWLDESVANGSTYAYALYTVSVDGARDKVAEKTVQYISNAGTITEYALRQNYPNPFNPSTTISYDLKESGLVKLSVFNLLGEKVAVLVSGTQTASTHVVTFDGSNLSSGVYVYKVEVNDFTAFHKMVLMR